MAKKTKSGKGAPKKATKKKVVAKKSRPPHRQTERVKSTQRVALVALPWHRPRTDKGSPQADEAKQAANDCVGPLLPDCGEVSHRNSRGVIGFELIGRSVSERLVDSL